MQKVFFFVNGIAKTACVWYTEEKPLAFWEDKTMPDTPRTFLLGTDWWTDCDDAVAIRILARAARAGEIVLAGVGISACMEHSVASLDGFLLTEGLRGVRLGLDREATDFGGNPPYQKRLAAYAVDRKSNNDAEDGVRMYRAVLAATEQPIEIIEIGYPQLLTNALMSLGDDISPLTGMELFRQKVKKIWMMAGKWDENPGRENNFARAPRSRVAAHVLCLQCPVPITFLGWEVGHDVISGSKLTSGVLYDALYDHGCGRWHTPGGGRSSWDPMLVELALIGDEDAAGYDTVRGQAAVDAETGENRFIPDESGLHRYVVRRHAPEYHAQRIDRLIAE